ncbi:Alpha/Beta hydrolase protein [Dunaliella salina]|uniref:Alpha/Beta hydrolase protein n=1 Tax=Dunaliella salina TaxID=3046 RepID=A0ABQ7G398_DUNSA|nr:Alpha/Beta hydrolase protein [Dunaliella salina]|eukprot:KAF5829084.1 Alpha/Beta hydrolase protein [Dunaliella salina]
MTCRWVGGHAEVSAESVRLSQCRVSQAGIVQRQSGRVSAESVWQSQCRDSQAETVQSLAESVRQSQCRVSQAEPVSVRQGKCRDTKRMSEYLEFNPFLPDINNEYPKKNLRYAANIASLDKLVLYKFTRDTTVFPPESSWFGLMEGGRVVKLSETDLYMEDFIGLRQLDESGRLELKEKEGEHLEFTLDWFESEILQHYLA